MTSERILGDDVQSPRWRWFKVSLLLFFIFSVVDYGSAAGSPAGPQSAATPVDARHMFIESERCIACHSNLTTPAGQDISIGFQWRTTMMALSARDPYWRAGVRRESIENPTAVAAIEDKCSVCHMPTAHTMSRVAGEAPRIFAIMEAAAKDPDSVHMALDGVTCSVCHQIKPDNFGRHESFDGGYLIDAGSQGASRPIFGPYPVDIGRQRVMHSSTGNFLPTESLHIRESGMCATCHTLYTTTLDGTGKAIGQFPEQMPYVEWQQSDYANRESCQACHMPVVDAAVPISGTLGQPRSGVSQHTFVGGNAYMLRLINKYRNELGAVAEPQELEASALRTEEFLRTRTAQVDISPVTTDGGRTRFTVRIRTLAGHKFPTAYPSRRAWLHVTVRDASGRVVFESGALRPDGAIVGNDNDEDAQRFEAHHDVIHSPADVQIYEAIMVDADNRVTTGLLRALRYVKDNRLLPVGFDKGTASADVTVQGNAMNDADFVGGGDSVRYDVDTGTAAGPLTVHAELRFQTIAYRWAQNLRQFDAAEPRTFIGYYDSTASQSAMEIASASASGS